MRQRYLKWLYKQLPGLVDAGVLTPETADRIRDHYGDSKDHSGRAVAMIVCSVLGALLIGLGIILLLAYNWSDLGRPMRTVLALAPLVSAQLLGVRGLLRGKSSTAWREGTATLQALAIGVAIALVGQTYHIPGDPGSFLLVWSLLALPLVYLLRSTLPAVLYLVGITAWSGYQQNLGGQAMLFWPLFSLAVPAVWDETKRDVLSVRASLLGWAAALCLCVATGITLEKVLLGLWIIIYGSLLAVFYLAGSLWFNEEATLPQRPFHVIGSVGIAALSLLLTYEFGWEEIGWHCYRHGARFHAWAAVPDYLLAAVLPVLCVLLLVVVFRRDQKSRVVFGLLPILTILAYSACALAESAWPGVVVFNIYTLAIGLSAIVVGLMQSRLGTINAGMAVVSALIVARFFDMELGFVARGIAFILLGSGFLSTNLVLSRRMRREKLQEGIRL